MDLRRIKYLSCMFEAYLEGKTVQIKYINTWKDITSVGDFHAFNNEFRIKPQRELVPFTLEDNLLFRDKWFKYKDGAFRRSFRLVTYEGDVVTIHNQSFSYQKFLDNYVFEDGSPCGKFINE